MHYFSRVSWRLLCCEPDVATEHIAPASLGQAREASPGSRDMTINSLADVVSKLGSECDESAVALCSAVHTQSMQALRRATGSEKLQWQI